MARKIKTESKVTFLNEPPSAEEIVKHLFTTYMRSQGFEVKNVEVTPSKTGKRKITVNDGEYLYTAIEGKGAKCERL
ncbi:MAG: hypothetical protein NSGCLCUN01_02728 [uncultured Clostridium sp.]